MSLKCVDSNANKTHLSLCKLEPAAASVNRVNRSVSFSFTTYNFQAMSSKNGGECLQNKRSMSRITFFTPWRKHFCLHILKFRNTAVNCCVFIYCMAGWVLTLFTLWKCILNGNGWTQFGQQTMILDCSWWYSLLTLITGTSLQLTPFRRKQITQFKSQWTLPDSFELSWEWQTSPTLSLFASCSKSLFIVNMVIWSAAIADMLSTTPSIPLKSTSQGF